MFTISAVFLVGCLSIAGHCSRLASIYEIASDIEDIVSRPIVEPQFCCCLCTFSNQTSTTQMVYTTSSSELDCTLEACESEECEYPKWTSMFMLCFVCIY